MTPYSSNLGIPQVRLHLAHLAKLLPRVLGAHARRHNDIIADLPVNGRGDALLVARLQAINHAQHLAGVAARRRGVHHGEADLAGGVDDEDGADGEGDALGVDVVEVLRVEHVVQEGDAALGVGDDGEGEGGAGEGVDVVDPAGVGGEVIGALWVGKGNVSAKKGRVYINVHDVYDLGLYKEFLELELGNACLSR